MECDCQNSFSYQFNFVLMEDLDEFGDVIRDKSHKQATESQQKC